MLGDFVTPDPVRAPPPRGQFAGMRHAALFRNPDFISHRINQRGHQEWSGTVLQEAIRLWCDGKTKAQIAEHFNVTLWSVQGMISRNRVIFPKRATSARIEKQPPSPRGRWQRPDERPTLLAASYLWKSGETVAAISHKLGIDKNIISGLAHRNRNLFPRRQSPIKRST